MKELDEALKELTRILEPVDIGRKDHPRRLRRIYLTVERMRHWHLEPSLNLGQNTRRGGTRAVLEQGETEEDYNLSRRTEYDARALARHLSAVAAICVRYTVPIDIEGLPNAPHGCRSCARLEDHFEPVADRYRAKQLCNWCGQKLAATGSLPPMYAIDLYARQGATAAGRWMAQHQPNTTPRRRKR